MCQSLTRWADTPACATRVVEMTLRLTVMLTWISVMAGEFYASDLLCAGRCRWWWCSIARLHDEHT